MNYFYFSDRPGTRILLTVMLKLKEDAKCTKLKESYATHCCHFWCFVICTLLYLRTTTVFGCIVQHYTRNLFVRLFLTLRTAYKSHSCDLWFMICTRTYCSKRLVFIVFCSPLRGQVPYNVQNTFVRCKKLMTMVSVLLRSENKTTRNGSWFFSLAEHWSKACHCCDCALALRSLWTRANESTFQCNICILLDFVHQVSLSELLVLLWELHEMGVEI